MIRILSIFIVLAMSQLSFAESREEFCKDHPQEPGCSVGLNNSPDIITGPSDVLPGAEGTTELVFESFGPIAGSARELQHTTNFVGKNGENDTAFSPTRRGANGANSDSSTNGQSGD